MKKLTLDMLKALGEVTLITRRNCLDDTGTAMVLKEFCNNRNINLNIVYLQYGDKYDINDFKAQNVIMCDFSFKRDETEKLFELTNSLVVIDHHKTAEAELKGLDYAVFDMDHSGAVLMYHFLYGKDKECPNLIKIIEDRDLWRFKLDATEAVTTALQLTKQVDIVDNYRLYLNKVKVRLQKAVNDIYEYAVDSLKQQGELLLKYRDSIVSRIIGDIDSIKTINICGIELAILNNFTEISLVGSKLSEVYGASIQYKIDHVKNEIIFSLRSVGDIDVGDIARKFGGDGHKNTASFSIPFDGIDFNKFLKGGVLEECLITE